MIQNHRSADKNKQIETIKKCGKVLDFSTKFQIIVAKMFQTPQKAVNWLN